MSDLLDWGDFVPEDERQAVGVALLIAGHSLEPDERGDVAIDFRLADDVLRTLNHYGWIVVPKGCARARTDEDCDMRCGVTCVVRHRHECRDGFVVRHVGEQTDD